ncbi:MAG: phosphatidylserine/phosphatidylglycerophosphate/cardiolipin synthase family protein [Alicyclobacillus herbarius]|uniref:phospholipase D-like domain-containing protein n=1 Tax=Alicyclobacillus herbarius TaxID=122960 RepID=UPI00235243C7|nr:phospholipase D-like domain-containing protein [Alicyclobacillus herbarius]MCL6631530.1 phosphatidylserine/phosphatidylglycerophosphate/cardiolipin synthase family protein [Alicyclobacillus herbarius]
MHLSTRFRSYGLRLLIFVAFTVSILFLPACGSAASSPKEGRLPAPVSQNGATLDWGKDVKDTALKMIRQSRHYCYLDIYELSDPDILQALVKAKRRHVDVRVVVDASESHSQEKAVPTLRHAGVPVESLRIHEGISHIKMLIADGNHAGVLIGGMNFGESSWENNDASVYLRDPNPSFLALFRWDWKRAEGIPAAAPKTQMPLITDREIEGQVVQAIQSARQLICLEAFDLTDDTVLNALSAAINRGVIVEVLLDPNQSYNRDAAEELRDAGATVRFYRPYGREWMHAKILDVDHGSTFIIGSANFSHQAYTYNHEGDLELHDMKRFDISFQADFSVQISRGTDYPVRDGRRGGD